MKTLWILYCIVASQDPARLDTEELIGTFATPKQCLSQKTGNCECVPKKERQVTERPIGRRGPTGPSGGFKL